ncbi:MAG TPA: acyltransferase family protein [Patescibacteria group bacterium]
MSSLASSRSHLYQVDMLRIFSALAIIFIHDSGFILNLYNQIPYRSWLVSMFLSCFFRWGTPVFIMISGYLLLGSNTLKNPKAFYKRRADKILIPLIFWNIFYFFLSIPFNSPDFTLANFWANFINGGTFYHLYFMFLISGLYLISPFLRWYIDHPNHIHLLVPFLIIASGFYFLGSIFLNWPALTGSPTIFILYIGYYLAGYWLSTLTWRPSRLLLFLSFLVILVATAANSYFVSLYGTGTKGIFLTHRLSLAISLPSLVIFSSLIKLNPLSILPLSILEFFRSLADLSLGVYLTHPAVIQIFVALDPYTHFMESHPLSWMLLTTALTSLISLYLVRLLKRLPLLHRLV